MLARPVILSLSLVAVIALTHRRAHADRRVDEHSYAEPTRVRTKDLALDLRVDFKAKQLIGTATLTVDWLDPQHATLALDTRDLKIAKVETSSDGAAWQPVKFTVGKAHPVFGSKLEIAAARAPQVRITYRTSPGASGLQWLPAKLTASGKQPFLFSQSQAIHARSWIPVQDTPGVRFTYTARIRTPRSVMALMSADNDPAAVRDGDYSFRMAEPIPAYLLALAVGELVFKPISARVGVWAEPSVIDGALAELADTDKMVVATEALYGPYRWGRYDLLMLPASFPFGGMENPRLSFITPTILVGDRSLVSLIAHELAHSWSGNLVTNATWKDIWLNEGFTTYVENRVVEAIYGKELAEIETVLTQDGLRAKLAKVPAAQQRLRLLASPGEDPDDSTGDVAYEKGKWFLQTLEQRFGRAVFDPFLRKWFDRHAFKSVTTEDFLAFLRAELLPRRPTAITETELLDWIDGEGIPKHAFVASSPRLRAVGEARTRWLAGAATLVSLGVERWSTQERVYFLDGLPARLAPAQLGELDRALALNRTQNGELAQRWYPLAERSGYRAARPALGAFVQRVGRRKLILPIYKALVTTPDGLAFAKQTFARARPGYHPITVRSVEAVLADARRKPTKR
ncbi:MAG: M1 family metallopeptidase [Myxococcota bacterium]|nr:M1 family metallopeptidase [Myxococcota bacterium]